MLKWSSKFLCERLKAYANNTIHKYMKVLQRHDVLYDEYDGYADRLGLM